MLASALCMGGKDDKRTETGEGFRLPVYHLMLREVRSSSAAALHMARTLRRSARPAGDVAAALEPHRSVVASGVLTHVRTDAHTTQRALLYN